MSRALRVVVASTNRVKLEAARGAFALAFPDARFEVEGLEVASGVARQPATDAETRRGARQRAEAARQAVPDADFCCGLEGGVDPWPDGAGSETVAGDGALWAFAWVHVVWRAGDAQGRGEARSAAFALPPAVAALVHQGVELGEADDRVFGRVDSKRQGGAVGLLTGGRLDRVALYQPAVLLALIPALQPALYPSFS